MAIDSLGCLRWTPTTTQLGIYPITLTITDEAGAKVTQQFNLTVTVDTEAPKVSLIGSTNIADIGDNLFFQARATDNIGIQNLQLFINDNPVAIPRNYLPYCFLEGDRFYFSLAVGNGNNYVNPQLAIGFTFFRVTL
jgi:hypothetical protein